MSKNRKPFKNKAYLLVLTLSLLVKVSGAMAMSCDESSAGKNSKTSSEPKVIFLGDGKVRMDLFEKAMDILNYEKEFDHSNVMKVSELIADLAEKNRLIADSVDRVNTHAAEAFVHTGVILEKSERNIGMPGRPVFHVSTTGKHHLNRMARSLSKDLYGLKIRLVPAGNQEINLSLEDRSKLLKYLLISESIFANTLQKDIDALSRDLVPMRVMVASFGYLLSIGLIASDFLILGFPALGYTMYKSYQALREMKLFDSINPNAIGIRANYFKGRALHNFFLGIKDFISKTEHAYSAQDLSPKSHTQSLSRDIPRHNLEARATLLKVLSSGLGPAQFAKICKNSSLN